MKSLQRQNIKPTQVTLSPAMYDKLIEELEPLQVWTRAEPWFAPDTIEGLKIIVHTPSVRVE